MASTSISPSSFTTTTENIDLLIFNPNIDYGRQDVDDTSNSDSDSGVASLDTGQTINASDDNDDATDDNDDAFLYTKFLITQVVYIPALIFMLFSCIVLVLVIMKHLRPLFMLYFSVLFYATTELFLLLVMVTSWICDVYVSHSVMLCQLKVTLHSFGLILPIYAVLLISIVRTIFVLRPFDYTCFIRMKYQLIAIAGFVSLCLLIVMLPHLGLCEVVMDESSTGKKFCRYGFGSVECFLFSGILVSFGYVLPIVICFVLYVVIYNAIVSHRRLSIQLQDCSTTQNSSLFPESSGSLRSRDKLREDQTSIPWCIIVVLVLYMLSTLPWVPMEIATDKIMDMLGRGGYVNLLLDLLYSLVLICLAISPIMYLVTSQTLKKLTKREFVKLKNRCCSDSIFY